MASVKKFEDLEIWKKARELCLAVYTYTSRSDFAKDRPLVNQINSASGSSMDNIAEGFDRGSRNAFIYFLAIAKGSAGEVKSQLFRAMDRKYITKDEMTSAYNLADEIGKGCSAMIRYMNSSNYKGPQFKGRV